MCPPETLINEVEEVVTEVLAEDVAMVIKGDPAEQVRLNNNNKLQTIKINDNNVDVNLILLEVTGNHKPVIYVDPFFISLEKMERTVQNRMKIFKMYTTLTLMKLLSVKYCKRFMQ